MMEAFAVYLLKSCALLAVFYLAYFTLLRRETFFTANRWYFMLGLVASVILPLVTYRRIIWTDPSPPASGAGQQVAQTLAKLPSGVPASIDWLWIAVLFYLLGIGAMLALFARDCWSLRSALRGVRYAKQADFNLLDTPEKVAPFSYFNYIVYNSSLYSEDELRNIIAHEKVHSEQNHTMDVIFARLFCIVFWFNPFIWLYRKAMLQNLEFIADSVALAQVGDRKSYQLTLLKVTAHESCAAISNQFYQSLIKKRIVMLNRNPSKKSSAWKYLLLVPALAVFMFLFQYKVVAQELPGPGTEVLIDKNTSDAELKSEAERLKSEHGVTLKFSKVKRNAHGEITGIKATYKDKDGKSGTTQVSGNDPISPIRFYKDNDAVGFGNGTRPRIFHLGKGDDDVFSFSFDNDDVDAPEPPEAPEPPFNGAPPARPHAPKPPREPRTEKQVIIKTRKDGHAVVMVDGKVVADVDKELADIGPIIVDGKDVMKIARGKGSYSFSSGDGAAIVIDTDEITSDALQQARDAVEAAKPQIEKARIQIEKSRERMRGEQNDQAEEMRQAKAEMEAARSEMEKARAEMEKARAALQAERAKAKKQ